MIGNLWRVLRSPSGKFSLGSIFIVGAVGGVLFWGAFNTAMEVTNTLDFCVSCHEMGTVYEEYKKSVHYKNGSGVRATCPDCHVPKTWVHKVARKIQATNELYHKFIDRNIDTPEKFEARRLHLAKNVWATMKETDSRECRNCHAFDTMKVEKQRKKAQKMHPKGIKENATCIDCHKGIAHKLPDMAAASRQQFEMLKQAAMKTDYGSGPLFTLATANLYATADAERPGGRVLSATQVEPIEVNGDRVKVKISGWSQEGAEKVIYALMGHRIFNAALGKKMIGQVERGETKTHPDTEQNWTKVSITGFMDKKDMVRDGEALWSYAGELYENSCSVCHNAPDTHHFMANQWIGVLKGMLRYTALTKDEVRLLQKYLQLNAQDTGGAHH